MVAAQGPDATRAALSNLSPSHTCPSFSSAASLLLVNRGLSRPHPTLGLPHPIRQVLPRALPDSFPIRSQQEWTCLTPGTGTGREGNCCLATWQPPSLEFFAEIQEQTTQPEKSGGLTEGGPDHIDQNQGQQPGTLAKEFSAEMIQYCACHPECVPTEDLVLSASVR